MGLDDMEIKYRIHELQKQHITDQRKTVTVEERFLGLGKAGPETPELKIGYLFFLAGQEQFYFG